MELEIGIGPMTWIVTRINNNNVFLQENDIKEQDKMPTRSLERYGAACEVLR
jgi:hypothetical protein